MKKIVLIIATLVVVAIIGFNVSAQGRYKTLSDINVKIITDENTCVMYAYKVSININYGFLTPLYKPDGTLRTNEECLNNK